MSSVFNELVITGTLRKHGVLLSGNVSFDITVNGAVSIPNVGNQPIPYTGVYETEPTFETQIFRTSDKKMLNDFTVLPIHTYETSNPFGTTFII